MAVQKINGVSSVNGGEYDELVVKGVITCNGDIKARTINIDGVVTVNGRLTAEESIALDGVMTVNGSVRGKEIRVGGVCTIRDTMEADHILCKGVITSKGQISADLVEGTGILSAKEIVGEKVTLHCEIKKRYFSITPKLSNVELIEATEIDIDGIKCENVNGHNITIGPNCIIENVDCSGTLSIAPTAQVANIKQPQQH